MDEKRSGAKWLPLGGVLLVVLLVLAGASLFYAFQGNEGVQRLAQQQSDLKAATGSVAAAASSVIDSGGAGFADLEKAVSIASTANAALPADTRPQAFVPLMEAVEKLTAGRQYLIAAASASSDASQSGSALVESLSAVAENTEGSSATLALEGVALTERIIEQVAAIAAGIGDPDVRSRLAGDDELRLGRIVLGLAGEDGTLGITPVTAQLGEDSVTAMTAQYRQLSDAVVAAVAGASRVSAAAQVAQSVPGLAAKVVDQISTSAGADRGMSIGPVNLRDPRVGFVLLGMALLVGLIFAGLSFSGEDTRRAAERQARQNERNQAAILRLLDELGSLADGDLTVQATVTEDITGAIADSINYAIEALRELVTTINDTAINIDGAARQTQATSGHLAQASETQSKQVADATESVARMAASVEAVSGDSERSADVARHSVDVAHKGGEAVRRTIEGMNTIRETIQDTSKRIKRLGESSQEIGNIVELINDIAEQTNILALNASIQASMAGEAGRGFAVVADEVQRLAERSANATRQIEVLVKTIQSDTNEAVVSMERSTTDVVGGALLAENAGAALDEIESVSNQIANLVQNISGTAREQATAAADITRNMGVLREVSSQTAEATGATSESIGKLADLAAQLRNSVAGFRLPESTGGKRQPEFPKSFQEADDARSASA
ncbi:MAG: methyl-accepting chemotaxis protein [Gammaproteobacteria bacterium]|nr:MAG: methyl-accepting chemotaxis protein [Gammaproteobacteria bacterium]